MSGQKREMFLNPTSMGSAEAFQVLKGHIADLVADIKERRGFGPTEIAAAMRSWVPPSPLARIKTMPPGGTPGDFDDDNFKEFLSPEGKGVSVERVLALHHVAGNWCVEGLPKLKEACALMRRDDVCRHVEAHFGAGGHLPFRRLVNRTIEALNASPCEPLLTALRESVAAKRGDEAAVPDPSPADVGGLLRGLLALHRDDARHGPALAVTAALVRLGRAPAPLSAPARFDVKRAACRLFQLALLRAVVDRPDDIAEDLDRVLVAVRADSPAAAVLLASAIVGGDVRFHDSPGEVARARFAINAAGAAVNPGGQAWLTSEDLHKQLLASMTEEDPASVAGLPAKRDFAETRMALDFERELHDRCWRIVATGPEPSDAGISSLAHELYRELRLHTVFQVVEASAADRGAADLPVARADQLNYLVAQFVTALERALPGPPELQREPGSRSPGKKTHHKTQ